MNKIILNSSLYFYRFLLQFYPKRYKHEFGNEMKFVFRESLYESYEQNGFRGIIALWARTIVDGLQSGPREHLENIHYLFENEKGGAYMSAKKNDLIMQNKIFMWGALATTVILLIPYLGRWPWSLFDFIFAGTLLFGTGSAFVLIARKAKSMSYRLGIGLAILTAMLLMWVSGAVGIIGDPEDGSADIPVKWINDASEQQMETKKSQIISVQKEYNELLKRIENLLDLKISPENINGSLLSDATFKEKNEVLLQKKNKLMTLLGNKDKSVNEWVEFAVKTFNFAATAQTRFKEGDMNDKKTILRAIGSNLYLKDGSLEIQPRGLFIAIEKAVKATKVQTESLEPNDYALNMGKTGDFAGQNLIVGGK